MEKEEEEEEEEEEEKVGTRIRLGLKPNRRIKNWNMSHYMRSWDPRNEDSLVNNKSFHWAMWFLSKNSIR